jgi:hypothetical protein
MTDLTTLSWLAASGVRLSGSFLANSKFMVIQIIQDVSG